MSLNELNDNKAKIVNDIIRARVFTLKTNYK